MTILLSFLMMAGLFLLLWAGVGFIQDKRFFTSAPKEVYELVQPKKERFSGQHLMGWILAIIAIFLMVGSLVLAALIGIHNNFTLEQFFSRLITILLLMKTFDIVFFDWVLLSNGGFGFFERYYHEVKEVLSSKLFGYNKKEHFSHIILMIIGAFVLAWICSLFL